MGRVVLIYGKSGSGKSRSLKNFNEDEIFLINVEGKDLPFRKTFKYETITDNYDKIQLGLTRMPVKTAVIDDAGYLLTNMFMRGHAGAHRVLQRDSRGGERVLPAAHERTLRGVLQEGEPRPPPEGDHAGGALEVVHEGHALHYPLTGVAVAQERNPPVP